MKKNKYKKIIDKAIELCMKSDSDELLYGDSYVEIGERSIRLIDPKEMTHTANIQKDKLYGKGLIEPKNEKSN